MDLISNDTRCVLIVPAWEEGRGGGHLSRCLFIYKALKGQGSDCFLFIPESKKDSLFKRFGFLFMADVDPSSRGDILFHKEDLQCRAWDLIVLDRFRTPKEEYAYWTVLSGQCRCPLIGIDEGGPCRSSFDFLVDLLPNLEKHEANFCSPGLLPMPRKRRPIDGAFSSPLRVLISFGAEDSAGLGIAAAEALARKPGHRMDITLIAPPTAHLSPFTVKNDLELSGIKIRETIPNLKEHLADYDLLVTHFGLGAFEALYARLGVLLISPTAYHEKLRERAGFLSLGVGKKGILGLSKLEFNNDFVNRLMQKSIELRKAYCLEEDQNQDLGSFLASLKPDTRHSCPVCKSAAADSNGKNPSCEVIGRFGEETYRQCPSCKMIFLSRLRPPSFEYDSDYFFDLYKKQYGKTYLEDFPGLKETGRKRLANIKSLLRKKRAFRERDENSGDVPKILDIGCAYGPFLAAAGEGGFSPCGMDPIEDAVKYVREELGFPAWQGLFPSGKEVEHAPYDVITLWYVIEHFDDPRGALGEIRSLLKDGGVIAFSTPSFSGISGRKDRRDFLKKSPADHFTIWSPGICKKVLSMHGFRLRKIVVTGHHPERFPLLGRFANPSTKNLLYKTLLLISRAFRLGDTMEVYASCADPARKSAHCNH